MKALHVRRLYLWPRFQAQARQDLEARPPQVRAPGPVSVVLRGWRAVAARPSCVRPTASAAPAQP